MSNWEQLISEQACTAYPPHFFLSPYSSSNVDGKGRPGWGNVCACLSLKESFHKFEKSRMRPRGLGGV